MKEHRHEQKSGIRAPAHSVGARHEVVVVVGIGPHGRLVVIHGGDHRGGIARPDVCTIGVAGGHDTIGDDNFFAQYVALRTEANLKVAYATPAEDPTEVFDLIIRGDGHVELKGFFNNIIEYLSMIKK